MARTKQIHKQRLAQNHSEHQYATDIQKKKLFLIFRCFYVFILFYVFIYYILYFCLNNLYSLFVVVLFFTEGYGWTKELTCLHLSFCWFNALLFNDQSKKPVLELYWI